MKLENFPWDDLMCSRLVPPQSKPLWIKTLHWLVYHLNMKFLLKWGFEGSLDEDIYLILLFNVFNALYPVDNQTRFRRLHFNNIFKSNGMATKYCCHKR